MGQGRLARQRARSRRSDALGPILAVAIAALSTVGLLLSGVGDARRGDHTAGSLRLVLAATGAAAPARRLATSALYAKNDPWKPYLASEAVCPGGERRDLPLLRQANTLACLVNFARRKRGLRMLSVIASLNNASARKAAAIRRCGTFAHNPCGGNWTASVVSTGYRGAFGENLYLGDGPFGAPRVAVDAWLNSPHHRENLFYAGWREQGLAVVVLERFGGYRNVAVFVNVLGGR